MTERVGILAYGSLISDPGREIKAATIRTIADIETPFAVEFARSSYSRGGAPTLVPVSSGGSKVRSKIIVVDALAEDATNMLYRREIHKVGEALPAVAQAWRGHD